MSNRPNVWRTTAGAALTLGLLASSALAQVAPTTPSAPPAAPDPMPPNGDPVAAPAALTPALAAYKSVTADRLTKPDDGDWLMFRRTYNGWGYSPLDQITTANASHLHPVWSMATGQIEGHQAPPIVNNGVMFVATPGNQVLASTPRPAIFCGVSSGQIPEEHSCCIRRVVASLCGATRCSSRHPTPHLSRWTQKPARRPGTPKWRTIQGLLHVIGAAGGRRQGAARHFRWRTWHARLRRRHSMPRAARNCGGLTQFLRRAKPAVRPGLRVISGKPAAARSGSPVMYDPPTSLAFWGTGNGGPWMGDQRPGDNFTLHPSSHSMRRLARSRGIINTIRTIRGTGTRCHRRSSLTT